MGHSDRLLKRYPTLGHYVQVRSIVTLDEEEGILNDSEFRT